MSGPDVRLRCHPQESAKSASHDYASRDLRPDHQALDECRIFERGTAPPGSAGGIERKMPATSRVAKRQRYLDGVADDGVRAKVALRYKRFPKQVVLYVGKRPLSMTGDYYANGDLVFRYKVVDIRELGGKKLLDSAGIEDNILAILARLGDKREAVRQIVGRTAKLDASARRSKLEQLSILAGLRKLEPLVKEEASRMPITEDILNHKIIGPAYRQGRQEGRQEGQQEGELELLRRQIVKRFGPIPAWLDERLARCSASDLLELGERLLDAQSLEDILK